MWCGYVCIVVLVQSLKSRPMDIHNYKCTCIFFIFFNSTFIILTVLRFFDEILNYLVLHVPWRTTFIYSYLQVCYLMYPFIDICVLDFFFFLTLIFIVVKKVLEYWILFFQRFNYSNHNVRHVEIYISKVLLKKKQ